MGNAANIIVMARHDKLKRTRSLKQHKRSFMCFRVIPLINFSSLVMAHGSVSLIRALAVGNGVSVTALPRASDQRLTAAQLQTQAAEKGSEDTGGQAHLHESDEQAWV